MSEQKQFSELIECEPEMREFDEAQKSKIPAGIDELRQATEHAFLKAESVFSISTIESTPQSVSYEQWVRATDALEEIFLENNDGVLGQRLIELLSLDDQAFALQREEAQKLLEQTTSFAHEVYSVIHRFVLLGFGSTREDVVRQLENGDLSGSIKVHDVSIIPVRKTVIGLLRDLDRRLGTQLWTLEYPPDISREIVVADPFSADASKMSYWRDKILAKRSVESGSEADVYSISYDVTGGLIFDLEAIGQQTDDEQLATAMHVLTEWLGGKDFYYKDPDPRDFELYYLGAEESHQMMEIIQALDVVKQKDPELFIEMVGINPEDGGRSAYFGSFLQKALFNTQRVVSKASLELGEMVIATMMRQLMDIDERVTPYAGVVSQEALKEMAGQITAKVAKEATPKGKSGMAMMLLVPYVPMAIDAAVREQLERLREVDIENTREELRRHLADRDHPLKIAEYIGSMPLLAFQDPIVYKLLRDIYPTNPVFEGQDFEGNDPEKIRRAFQIKDRSAVYPLYDRIPLLDVAREDFGYGLLARVMVRDALSFEKFAPGVKLALGITDPVDHRGLEFIHQYFYYHRSVSKGVRDQLQAQTDLVGSAYLRNLSFIVENHLDSYESDIPYLVAEQIINEEVEKPQFTTGYLESGKADQVFLALLAHPGGAEVAFKHFYLLCQFIEPRRMKEILHDELAPGVLHPGIDAFRAYFGIDRFYRPLDSREIHASIFSLHKPFAEERRSRLRAQVSYLREKIIKLQTSFQFGEPEDSDVTLVEYIDLYMKMNRAITEGIEPLKPIYND